jgi:hypothetical protein
MCDDASVHVGGDVWHRGGIDDSLARIMQISTLKMDRQYVRGGGFWRVCMRCVL